MLLTHSICGDFGLASCKLQVLIYTSRSSPNELQNVFSEHCSLNQKLFKKVNDVQGEANIAFITLSLVEQLVY